MSNYRNFNLAVYFIARGTAEATPEYLQVDIDFFKRHLHLDRVYLEAYRDGVFASEDQVRMCKEIFEKNGIRVSGGITTTIFTPEGDAPKQRMFNTFCYNDEKMLARLAEVSALNGKIFDDWIVDDFYFTNCTCATCRQKRDLYNAEHGIEGGRWEDYRMDLMREVSEKYMIAPSKAANPNSKIIIKYPNWMESFQETGYNPIEQTDMFDGIYTGTETRDPVHTDQHLPRYLSFSLMRYFEALSPGRNGGGWFDPYDCKLLEYYLEQAYLTAFSKPKELMMFCFQSLVDTVNVPALGFMLDKLDALMDHMGEVQGVPCYIPNNAQGEDNIQDFLGMHGMPIVTTPNFPKGAPTMLLTQSATYDKAIINKLEAYVAEGGKAIVTSGFVKAGLKMGLQRMTSLRDCGRKAVVKDFLTERLHTDQEWEYPHGLKEMTIPVLEVRNNATWGAPCKGIREEESYTMLARDTYGNGQMMTIAIPESFSDYKYIPAPMLSRIRKEFALNGVYLEGAAMISLFMYDNDSLILYPYVDRETQDTDIYLHVKDAQALVDVIEGTRIAPLYTRDGEAVFELRANVGTFRGYRIIRAQSETEVVVPDYYSDGIGQNGGEGRRLNKRPES